MRKLIPIFFLLYASWLHAQEYTGVIKDAKSGVIIPYVNIGIVNKGVGTVSQGDGSFHIPLSEIYDKDTLRFSMIGYSAKNYLVKNFKQQYSTSGAVIYLDEAVTELQTVIVKPKKLVSLIKGNTFDSKSFAAGWKSDDLGGEMGTIINIKKGTTYYLKNVQVNIAWCKYDSILFRMNLYNLQNGKPNELLQSIPIYLRVYMDQRYLYVDLEQYNITVQNDFLIALEWLDDLPDKPTSMMFCAGMFGASTCYRKTSQDSWQKVPIGLGFSVELEYEKE